MRASVKAAKSSAENPGRCLPTSSGTSGGSAKMVGPELLLVGTKFYDGPLHGSPHGKGLTLPRSIESGNLSHTEPVIRLMPTMGDFLQLFWARSNDRQSTAIRRPSNRFLAGRIGCFRA